MNKLQLFRLLRKNTKLSEKRHPMFEANQYGKVFAYIGIAVFAIEFIALGTFLGWIAAKEDTYEGIFFFMPFLLIIDFGMRFMTQQTPLMLVKPYLLTPISKYSAIECFLISQLLDTGNLVWMTLFLPYAFIVWCGGLSFWATIGLLLLLYLMILVNSQWYLLVRTLVNQSIWWWALPICIYGAFILPLFVLSDEQGDMVGDAIDSIFEHSTVLWWIFLVFAILFCLLFMVNRHLQMRLIYDEISKHEKTKLKHVSEFNILNRFGQIGEYLKLEIKSTMRNKAIRSRFIQGMCFITFFSLMIAFSNVYSSSFEHNFWCLYAFVFFGTANLVKVMAPEGNYIDLLMVYKENILTLLHAKYYFYCSVLLLPLLIMLPPVIMGKFSILMMLAYLFTATGPIYCMLFQMAVYNKTTLALNENISGRNQLENKWTVIIPLIGFIVPIAFVMLLQAVFSENVAYGILICIGLLFTLSESYWMQNIYRRMMRRRYQNLEGFHSTR